MSNGAVVAAAAAGAIAKAIKASGVVVRVRPEDFESLLSRAQGALVVHAQGGLFSTKYMYLLSYKGLAFFTKSGEPIQLPAHVEMIDAARIWAPS